MKIDHIGIAVNNLEDANALFKDILGEGHYKIEEIESENVLTSFFRAGESKIELLESTSDNGPIARFLEKRGPGIHHIAFDVDDINEKIAYFKQKGFRLINHKPKMGADNKIIAFLHPKDTSGVLVELCQDVGKTEM